MTLPPYSRGPEVLKSSEIIEFGASYITFFEKSMFKECFCNRCQTVGFNGEYGL